MNIIFQTKKKGHTFNLKVSYGATIDQLLKYYLRIMKKPELIGENNKIAFIFNGSKLKFGDQKPIKTYIWHNYMPKIVVNFAANYIFSDLGKWTKGEVEKIKMESEKIELEFEHLVRERGEINVNFNKNDN